MADVNNKPTDLWAVWFITFGSLVLASPFYSYLVFGLGFDRVDMAKILAVHATLSYWLGMCAPLLPLPKLSDWTGLQRIQSACIAFMLASYLTHLSWELIWLIFHEAISNARDKIWAYPWWAYIDGGDIRYFHPKANFLMIEILSVTNGCIGITGLYLLRRSNFKNILGILMCMATAVTHTIPYSRGITMVLRCSPDLKV